MKRNIVFQKLISLKWRLVGLNEVLRQKILEMSARRELRRRWVLFEKGKAIGHNLDGVLIVSLTSYPPRFPTLHLTLQSLLCQSQVPDRLILWVAHEDFSQLPKSVTDLVGHGLELRSTENTRSYKKIIPTKLEVPDAFIVTADDDVYYEADWLERLCELVTSSHDIVCHRAHQIEYTEDGHIKPYAQWKFEVCASSVIESAIFPTGVGGILYSPHSLHAQTTNIELFSDLSPYTDDVWLAWMGRLADARYKLVRKPWRRITWSKTQEIALANQNLFGSGNDEAIEAMTKFFGPMRS